MTNSQIQNWSKRDLFGGTLLALISATVLPEPGGPITKRQNALIWGTILGDGHLQLSPNSQKVRLRFDHGAKQSEYVWWLYKNLKSLCEGVSPPKIIPEREFFKCRAYTKYSKDLKKYHDLTYVKSAKANRRFEKVLPADLADYVKDPEILMVWLLDDGTLRRDSGALRLTTQGFTLEEHEILQSCLSDNFGITSVIEKWPKGKAGLYMKRQEASKFVDLFSSTVVREIPSMLYKINLYL